jgi:hypothetical protein
MREVEADLVDQLLAQIKVQFGEIRFMEVGVFGAGTTRGVYRWGKENNCPISATGVDFEQYRPNPTPDPSYVFHSGDSMDKWRDVNGTFNFLFIDACHCVVHSSQDFLNYTPFVVERGYILLHDTALPTDLGKDKQEEWPQDHSYAGKSNSVLGVREALKKLGLLDNRRADFKLIEEIPSSTGLMGMTLYQRILPY